MIYGTRGTILKPFYEVVLSRITTLPPVISTMVLPRLWCKCNLIAYDDESCYELTFSCRAENRSRHIETAQIYLSNHRLERQEPVQSMNSVQVSNTTVLVKYTYTYRHLR